MRPTRDEAEELQDTANMAAQKAGDLAGSAKIWGDGPTGHETPRMAEARHRLSAALSKAAEAWQEYGAEVAAELRKWER